MLVIWRKYDPYFTFAGAWKYHVDVPASEVHIVEGGHFALNEAEPKILNYYKTF